jgi:hypothetical protein
MLSFRNTQEREHMAEEKQSANGVDPKILEMWRKDGWLFGIVGLLIGLALGIIILPAIAALENADDIRVFLNDLAPELIGILITVFVIDRLNRRRDERNAEEALKRQLVDDAASTSSEVAKNAVHQMRRKGWLTGEGGLLKDADLGGAHLDGANLNGAHLDGASLRGADLHGANLNGAHLDGAYLFGANLDGAYLFGAHLEGAHLTGAHLEGAHLFRAQLDDANLTGAQLDGANLCEANLQNAQFGIDDFGLKTTFNEKTILPDYTMWTPETDMTRFNDPNHPDFWKPNWVKNEEE